MLRAIASTKSPRIRHSDESSPFPPSLQISLRQIFVNRPGETNWLPLNSRWRTNIRARDELRPCREKISWILRCAPGPVRFVTWTLYFLLSSPFLFFFFFVFEPSSSLLFGSAERKEIADGDRKQSSILKRGRNRFMAPWTIVVARLL